MNHETNNQILIGLAGQARVGKDTVAAHLRDRYGFSTIALADPIKDAVCGMLGIDRVTLDSYPKEDALPFVCASPRELFQTLGTDWGRTIIGRDVWLKLAAQRWYRARLSDDFNGLVVTDVRMPNEAAWIREHGGVLIHVTRQDRQAVRSHISEQPLPVFTGDFQLRNDGTFEELFARCDVLVSMIRHTYRRRTAACS